MKHIRRFLALMLCLLILAAAAPVPAEEAVQAAGETVSAEEPGQKEADSARVPVKPTSAPTQQPTPEPTPPPPAEFEVLEPMAPMPDLPAAEENAPVPDSDGAVVVVTHAPYMEVFSPTATPEAQAPAMAAADHPDFKQGYALLTTEAMCYSGASPNADPLYYLEKGVLYVSNRRTTAKLDRLEVNFCGKGEAMTAWVNASALRLLSRAETETFVSQACARVDTVYLNGNDSLPLADVRFSAVLTYFLEEDAPLKNPAMLVAQERITLGVNEKITLGVSFTDGRSYSTRYSSDNTKIATVSADGMVTAKKRGSTLIRINSEIGNELTVHITVNKAPESVEITAPKTTLGKGEEIELSTVLSSGSASALRFSSSKSSVITVSANGKVTAVGAGKATVTVKTYNGRKDTLDFTVKAAPKTIAITAGNTITMGVGETIPLEARLSEGSAGAYAFTLAEVSGKCLTINGENNRLKALRTGSAILQAATYNNIITQAQVQVLKAPTSAAFAVDSVTIGVGEKLPLPEVRMGSGCGGGYTLESSKTRYATVSASGVITGVRTGSCKITLTTYNGKTAVLNVTVKKAPSSISLSPETLSMGVGEETTLRAGLPENTGGSVSYASSNSSVVSISTAGRARALKKGSATITATSFNGKTAKCTITVAAAPESIAFGASSIALGKGEERAVTAAVNRGSAGSIRYEIANTSIATVNAASGMVSALKTGSTTLSARSYNGKTAKCTITVKNAPESISLQQTSITIAQGDSYKIPAPKLSSGSACTSYTYKSSYKKYASVSAAGVVTAHKKGSAKITVSTYNDKEATLRVTIAEAPTAIAFTQSTATLYVGESLTPEVRFSNNLPGSYSLASSSKAVVSVSGGTVQALKPGTATITATSFNGKTATMKITVPALPTKITLKHHKRILGKGDSAVLPAVMPEGQGCALRYTSSNTSIATVENSGRVSALKPGSCIITVHTVNGLTDQCTLTVKEAPTALRLNPASACRSINEGSMTLTPEFASDAEFGSISYASSDKTIATVAAGKVSFKALGTVRITATTYNGLSAVCNLTICERPGSISFPGESCSICVGDSMAVPVHFDEGGESYSFTVADRSIARAEGDTVYALKKGSTTLTVTSASGLTDSCTLKVISAPTGVSLSPASAELQMGLDPDLQLEARALPGGIGSLRFTSSNPAVARVDYYTGLVHAVGKGSCIITASTYNGGASAQCRITVNALLDGVRVGIDPGHQAQQNLETEPSSPSGGSSKAKVSSGTTGVSTKIKEYQTNLTVGLKLRKALESLGADVYMTRESNNVDISNRERALMMNELGVDMVLRLHCNSGDSGSINGVDVYIRKSCAWPDDVVNGDKLLAAEDSLARAVFEEYLAATELKRRSIRKNNEYTGNNWSTVPCLLLEMGFSSNSEEDRKLNDPAFQEKMVQGMVNGICKYMGRDLAYQN